MIDFSKIAKSAVGEICSQVKIAREAKIIEHLSSRFNAVRKNPSDDLPKRIEKMQARIIKMVAGLKIEYEAGVLVVKPDGFADQTLKMLERGTEWFEPLGDVKEEVVGIVFKSNI